MMKNNAKIECHGHENNFRCQYCDKWNLKTFSWDMICPENKEMLNYRLQIQAQEKDKKNQKKVDFLSEQSDMYERDRKIPSIENVKKLSFAKDDFYYDFMYGCRFGSVQKSYLVKIFNADTGNELCSIQTTPEQCYFSPQKFYVRWGMQVYLENKLFFKTELDLKGKNVLIISFSKCLGDNLAWIKAVENFRIKHQCQVSFLVPKPLIEVFENNYPEIKFIQAKDNAKYQACYYLRCGNQMSNFETIVNDRIVALDKVAENILGVQHQQETKKLIVTKKEDFGGDYVCYSETASTKMKQWNNPQALKQVIEYIQKLGLKVVNIDQKPNLPDLDGVIYLNGEEYSVQDRINTLSGAKFFIGMASGLSWLAWSCHIPSIVISGFSLPMSEFDNPYRVTSTDYCFGCWNFSHAMKCSNEKNQYICNKSITSKQVINKIQQVMKDLKND